MVCVLSQVQLFATPWTVARQAPRSMECFQARILEWVAISHPGALPYPGIKLASLALAGRFFTAEPPGKPIYVYVYYTSLRFWHLFLEVGMYKYLCSCF